MMNVHFRQYVETVRQLVATMVIKSEHAALKMNELLRLKGFDVSNDEYTWRYYLNLSGEYHESDEKMYVTSMDTHELIPFDKETLAIHRGTKRAYAYGSTYYDDICANYPGQTVLINGILNPIDIAEAVNAKDHTILHYKKSFVEHQEYSLIPHIQKWIHEYWLRWFNEDYTLLEPWYYAINLGSFYPKLVSEILTYRETLVKTNQVHSFHMRQYLLSWSPIGEYFDYMTLEQKLWFYRNIKYINRNIGQSETFYTLVQKVLTDRGFGLSGHRLSHDYRNLYDKLDPEVFVDRVNLNDILPADGATRLTLSNMIDNELDLARDNYIYRDEAEDNIRRDMVHYLSSDMVTRDLESNVIDRKDSEPYDLTTILLNHWVYLSANDHYRTVIQFVSPNTGDTYRLNAKDAFIFYLYSYNAEMGMKLDYIPKVFVDKVVRVPKVTRDELLSVFDTTKAPASYIDWILDTTIEPSTFVSVDAFREYCVEVQNMMVLHREARHLQQDYVAEGEVHAAINRIYVGQCVELIEGKVSYDDWLYDKGIDVEDMSRVDFMMMNKSILDSITGEDIGVTVEMSQIHKAMINIMSVLNGYTLQFISTINNSPIKVVEGSVPKYTIPEVKQDTHYDVVTDHITVLDLTVTDNTRLPTIPVAIGIETFVSDVPLTTIDIPINMEVRNDLGVISTYETNLYLPTVSHVPDPIVPLPDGEQAVNTDIRYMTPADVLSQYVDGPTLDDLPLLDNYAKLSVGRFKNFMRF